MDTDTGVSGKSPQQVEDDDLLNLDDLAADPVMGGEGLGGAPVPLGIPFIDKPGKQTFFRLHPEHRLVVYCFKDENAASNDNVYAVAPGIFRALEEPPELVRKELRLGVTERGDLFVCTASLDDTNTWNASRLAAYAEAETKWGRMASNRAAGTYRFLEARHITATPQWPEMPWQKVLGLALRKTEKLIELADHPIIQKYFSHVV